MEIRTRVKWGAMFVIVFGAVVVHLTVAVDVQDDFVARELRSNSRSSIELSSPKVIHRDARTRVVGPIETNYLSTTVTSVDRSEGRFFLKISDIVSELIQQNIESVPPPLRGPLLFFLGFSQQSMENVMSNMRSFGRMIITSLVMMAVKRIYFADLPTEADRNKASQLTDSILDMVNLVF